MLPQLPLLRVIVKRALTSLVALRQQPLARQHLPSWVHNPRFCSRQLLHLEWCSSRCRGERPEQQGRVQQDQVRCYQLDLHLHPRCLNTHSGRQVFWQSCHYSILPVAGKLFDSRCGFIKLNCNTTTVLNEVHIPFFAMYIAKLSEWLIRAVKNARAGDVRQTEKGQLETTSRTDRRFPTHHRPVLVFGVCATSEKLDFSRHNVMSSPQHVKSSGLRSPR
jgi:hypothetical protein